MGEVYEGVGFGAHWGHEQLNIGPIPMTQAVVVLHKLHIYFCILHRFTHKWCEEKNFKILMSAEKSMLKGCKNMCLLSLYF